ncbi:MAG: TIGR02677 family protein [Sedimentibacter sp.]
MKITDKLMKQITETKYLTVENSWRYRVIIRYFYEQFEQINYILYKEDVYDELIKNSVFSDYTIEQCSLDLEVLTSWGNLMAIQDTAKVQTIAEFKNKKYRYEITQYTIEIERLTVKLENLKVEGASLEPSLLERIKNYLALMKENLNKDDKLLFEWWSDLISDFERLNINYQDYIKQIYSLKPEEMMKTGVFLIFKEKLIDYLRDFIKTLQFNIYEIEDILKNISPGDELKMYDKITRYSLSIPRAETVTYDEISENIIPKWKNIKRWFAGDVNRTSEAEKLFDITNEIIRKLTRYAAQLSESMTNSINRKEDYKKLCELFLKTSDIDDTHRLSAYVFGIENMRHIQGEFERKTESVNSDVFDEEPFEVVIKPRTRTYRERAERNAIKDKSAEKQEMLNKILDERKTEAELINKYINNSRIDFENLGFINQYVRTTLLRWLSNSMTSNNYTAKNENGNIIKVLNPDEEKTCFVSCEDGDFLMPAFVLHVEQNT